MQLALGGVASTTVYLPVQLRCLTCLACAVPGIELDFARLVTIVPQENHDFPVSVQEAGMDHLVDAPIGNILILAGVIFLAVGLFGRIGGFIGSIFGNIEAGKNSRVLAGVLGILLIVGGVWMHQDVHQPAASSPTTIASAPSTSPGTGTAPGTSTSPAPRMWPEGTTPASETKVSPETSAKVKDAKPQPSPNGAPPRDPPKPASIPESNRSAPTPAAPAVARLDSPLTIPGAHSNADIPRPSGLSAGGDDRLIGTWTDLYAKGNGIKRVEIARTGQDLDAHIWHNCNTSECDHGIHKLTMQGNRPSYSYADGKFRRVGSLDLYAPGVLLVTVDILEPGTTHHWGPNHHVLVKSTLSEKTMGAFTRYLNKPGQKAFALTPGGMWAYQFGSSSTEKATRGALQTCEKSGKPGCRIILINDDAAD